MTAFMWFQVAQAVLLALCTLCVWGALRLFKAGAWSVKVDHTEDILEIQAWRKDHEEALASRFDRASSEMSRMTGRWQTEAAAIRSEFVSVQVFDREMGHIAEDKKWTNTQIDRMWGAIRTRGESRT